MVAVGVFGRHRITAALRALGERVGSRSVILLPQDLTLAAGGRVPLVRLTTHSVRAQRQIASVLQDGFGHFRVDPLTGHDQLSASGSPISSATWSGT